MSVRVRYAPSPTGHLHIGNARTALFNYLFAKKHKGSFIVRIEDTDTLRNVTGGEASQLNYLKWLGIDWDESIDKDQGFGPYRQSDRLTIYQKYANELLERNLAYKCYCTKEELEEERKQLIESGADKYHYSRKCLHAPKQDKPYTIRFLVPANKTYKFNDIVKNKVEFQSEDIGDWVIMKQDGIPTYNFACAVDDHLMEISHVLRGEDHITNTPKQLMVYDAFDWKPPIFGHMTLIVNENGKKLSKRDQSIIQFIEQYDKLGYVPEAMFNFISLLGWSPQGKKEILSKQKIIKQFDERRLSTSPATFDQDKLSFINNRYIKRLSTDQAVSLCRPFLEEAGITKGQDDKWIELVVTVFQDRISHGKEIVDAYNEFFNQEFTLNQEMKDLLHQDGVNNTLRIFKQLLEELDTFDADHILPLIKQTQELSGAKGKMLYMPLRVATTAQMHGPDLPYVLALLGKDTVIKRLNKQLSENK